MSSLINVSDDVYQTLTGLKKLKNASYSEVIRGMLNEGGRKKYTISDILDDIKTLEKGKKAGNEKIDHDLIAYGVSRAGSG